MIYALLNRRHPRDRHRLALRHRPRPRRPRAGGRRLAGGHLQRDLPARRRRRGRRPHAVPAVLLAGRGAQPRQRADARAASTRAASSATPSVHAAGAAFDNPDLTVACVVGDGEAETGPLSGSWRMPAFLNARRDGAVLPILHLNGYKIAGPTVLGRSSDEDVAAYLRGQGWDPVLRRGRRPARGLPGPVRRPARRAGPHPAASGPRPAPVGSRSVQPAWPAIVLRTPKGWTGPDVVDGIQVQGTFRAHQVPLAGLTENPEHLRDAGGVAAFLLARDAVRRRAAGSCPSCAPWRRRATGGCRPRRTPTAAGSARSCRPWTSRSTRCRSRHLASSG